MSLLARMRACVPPLVIFASQLLASTAEAATPPSLPPRVVKLHEGTPLESKYLGVVLVSDSLAVREQGNVSQAKERARELLRRANGILEDAELQPRLRLALVDHVTFERDPYSLAIQDGETSAEELLAAFNGWAASSELPAHDVHILLTGFDLGSADVGATALGGACLSGYNGLVVQDRGAMASIPEQVLVHEVGHLLAMGHDGSDNACAASGFLMAPVAVPGGLASPQFSDCSRAEFAIFLQDSFASRCISDVPSVVAEAMCGDGVRSGDEACDCGETDACDAVDPCCLADCTLAVGAVCSNFNDPSSCCSAECQIAPPGEVCRAARDSCDAAEACTGLSANCPGDGWPTSGTECVDREGVVGGCFRGVCSSRTQQCIDLGDEIGVGLVAPREQCLQEDSLCAEVTCWYSNLESCLPVGRPVVDGVPCGGSSQCLGGRCVESSTIDECPASPKQQPGVCGCDQVDADDDADGTPSCLDACPTDPRKVAPGNCGCGIAEAAECPEPTAPPAGGAGGGGEPSQGEASPNAAGDGCSCTVYQAGERGAWLKGIAVVLVIVLRRVRAARGRARTGGDLFRDGQWLSGDRELPSTFGQSAGTRVPDGGCAGRRERIC